MDINEDYKMTKAKSSYYCQPLVKENEGMAATIKEQADHIQHLEQRLAEAIFNPVVMLEKLPPNTQLYFEKSDPRYTTVTAITEGEPTRYFQRVFSITEIRTATNHLGDYFCSLANQAFEKTSEV